MPSMLFKYGRRHLILLYCTALYTVDFVAALFQSYWSVTLVQLIALMYKDQHISTLQKLLNLWFEASLSESSEDNESNTSPPVSVTDINFNALLMMRNKIYISDSFYVKKKKNTLGFVYALSVGNAVVADCNELMNCNFK
jgi:hypothetical protein